MSRIGFIFRLESVCYIWRHFYCLHTLVDNYSYKPISASTGILIVIVNQLLDTGGSW